MHGDIKNVKNVELIMWAFEKGYRLGCADMKEGIHISFSEIEKCFIEDLAKFESERIQLDRIGLGA